MNTDIKTSTSAQNIVSAVGELPASPAIVSRLMGLTSDLDTKVADISGVLASDQSLTAKVLKLSNSSFYGRPSTVTTLEEAIMMLGYAAVQSLVIATSAHSMYNKDDKDGSKKKLWCHSLAAAIAVRQIALHVSSSNKEELFIAGLLHDIGKLVLMDKLPDQYGEVIAEVAANEETFFEVESRLLGFTHCDVALLLLESWSFPSSLTTTVVQHHQLPPIDKDEPIPDSYVVSLGNDMAKTLEVGFCDRKITTLSESAPARAFGLDETILNQITQTFTEHYNLEKGIFEGS